jgi:hypothetical protein
MFGGIRFAGGVGLVAVAAFLFATHARSTYQHFDSTLRAEPSRNELERFVAPGDMTGLDRQFQEAALSLLPTDATYTVIPPPTPAVALEDYGMNSITQAGLVPWLRYLLLPRRLEATDTAQYVLCYGCDTTAWDKRTTWLWKNVHGQEIGKVNGR